MKNPSPGATTATDAAGRPGSAIYPSLAGKRVVVTGGGSGIGAGIVEAFARQGAKVHFLDIAEADSRALEATLSTLPVPPTFVPCDLTNLATLAKTFADIGTVDILINNAANDDRHKLTDVTPEYWEGRMAVN